MVGFVRPGHLYTLNRLKVFNIHNTFLSKLNYGSVTNMYTHLPSGTISSSKYLSTTYLFSLGALTLSHRQSLFSSISHLVTLAQPPRKSSTGWGSTFIHRPTKLIEYMSIEAGMQNKRSVVHSIEVKIQNLSFIVYLGTELVQFNHLVFGREALGGLATKGSREINLKLITF